MAVDNSERAEQLIEHYRSTLSSTPWIAPMVWTYEKTKHSHMIVEEGLGRIEGNLFSLSTFILSLTLSAINVIYVIPIQKISNGSRKIMEWTTNIMKGTANCLINLSTLSIGIVVVSIEGTLNLSIGSASILLDAMDIVKITCINALDWSIKIGRKANDFISEQIELAMGISMVPILFTTDSLHSMLDIIQGFMDNKMEMIVDVSLTASLLNRIHSIITAISNGLSSRAHSHVIDPAHYQFELLIDQTKKSLIVLEVIRERGEWVVERMENVSNAVSQWKMKMEEEAKQYRVSPEVILLKAIHSSTRALTHNMMTLKEKNSKVFGDVILFDRAIVLLESMGSSLKEKKDIYEVRDELISQTRDQLVSLSHSLRQ
ncbi:plin-1 [Pristionchus pacificus]|uniref:Plin-1 n=1 Tax=Pristionchus pacificus TaxID=54126 RepID=A0A2A6BKJ4_PRIPA|nr:plin-1 [Pristionchus pacificus]|eukprot:PDM66346.1 plin-1 [Pristionchus pacificus]